MLDRGKACGSTVVRVLIKVGESAAQLLAHRVPDDFRQLLPVVLDDLVQVVGSGGDEEGESFFNRVVVFPADLRRPVDLEIGRPIIVGGSLASLARANPRIAPRARCPTSSTIRCR